jgi:glutathione S-transferase
VEKDLAKGVRAFKQLARFSPFIAGANLTYADCAAGAHLPLVSLSSKIVYGRDVLDDCTPVKPYLKMLNERPAFRKMNDDRKAATEAMAAARAKKAQ